MTRAVTRNSYDARGSEYSSGVKDSSGDGDIISSGIMDGGNDSRNDRNWNNRINTVPQLLNHKSEVASGQQREGWGSLTSGPSGGQKRTEGSGTGGQYYASSLRHPYMFTQWAYMGKIFTLGIKQDEAEGIGEGTRADARLWKVYFTLLSSTLRSR